MPDFSICRNDTGLKVVGELDVATAPQLTDALGGMSSQPELVLDLSEVTFLDSYGAQSILAIAATRNGNGPIVILPSRAVARVFGILAIDQYSGIEVRHVSDPPVRTTAPVVAPETAMKGGRHVGDAL